MSYFHNFIIFIVDNFFISYFFFYFFFIYEKTLQNHGPDLLVNYIY